MKERKKGISLITLGVTISVMILIAGAIILSTSGEGIFNKADEAVLKDEVKAISEAMENKMMVGLVRDDDYDKVENYTSGEYLVSNMDNDLKSAIRGDLNDDISVYKYYVLDMQKLVDDYGVPKGTKGYGETEDDIYIIEEETRNIYYVKTPYPFVSKAAQESPEDMELEMIEAPELSVMATEYIYNTYQLKDGTFYFSTENNQTYEGSLYYYDGSIVTKLNLNNYYIWDTSIYETKDNKVYLNYGEGSLYKLSGATATKVQISEYLSYYCYFLEYNDKVLFQDEYAGTFTLDDLSATKILDGDGYGSMTYSKKDNNLYISKYSNYDGTTLLYRFDGTNIQEIFNPGYNGYISINMDTVGNVYIYGRSDNEGTYIKKVEGNTLISITGFSGNFNGGMYINGKEVYIRTMYDVYKIVGNQAIRINLPAGFINGILMDRLKGNTYIIVSGQGLFHVQGTNGVKVNSMASGSTYLNSNIKRKQTYVYQTSAQAFLLNDAESISITGMLGSSSTNVSLTTNNFNGKMYAYDRDSSYRYNFYKIEGSTATKIQGINSTNSGYFRMNNYNGEVFFSQGNNLYRITDTKAELITNSYSSINILNNGNAYVTTTNNKIMKIVYK
ncbi:MAG: hypothetical protein PHR25_02285 [Clostridia bacterium]|nr:hypothetical protein [Clostridia bacterium]MDD4375588.1 hypothetical protein [Clostridia bacterium]